MHYYMHMYVPLIGSSFCAVAYSVKIEFTESSVNIVFSQYIVLWF